MELLCENGEQRKELDDLPPIDNGLPSARARAKDGSWLPCMTQEELYSRMLITGIVS